MPSSKKIGHSTVIIAKALALRDGLHHIVTQGHQYVQVEGDSKLLIDNINGKIPPPYCIQFLVQDLLPLASCCTTISFFHIHGEINFVVDAVKDTRYLLSYSLPFSAMNAFYFDQLGLDCNAKKNYRGRRRPFLRANHKIHALICKLS